MWRPLFEFPEHIKTRCVAITVLLQQDGRQTEESLKICRPARLAYSFSDKTETLVTKKWKEQISMVVLFLSSYHHAHAVGPVKANVHMHIHKDLLREREGHKNIELPSSSPKNWLHLEQNKENFKPKKTRNSGSKQWGWRWQLYRTNETQIDKTGH